MYPKDKPKPRSSSYMFSLTGPDIIIKPVMVPTTPPRAASGSSIVTTDGLPPNTRVYPIDFEITPAGEFPVKEVGTPSDFTGADVDSAGNVSFPVNYKYVPEDGGEVPEEFEIMAAFTVTPLG